MNIFIIPSWYPSEAFPSTGIFFKEQGELIAKHRPYWNVGISTWGSHDPRLWIEKSRPVDALTKVLFKRRMFPEEQTLQPNCIEYFNPAFTWTRKIRNGNIRRIIQANEENLKQFSDRFGEPDVIHAHVAYPAGFIAMTLSERFGIPYIITEHMGPFPFQSLEKEMEELILNPMRHAAKVLAVSANLTDRIRSFGVKAEQTSNFIDDSFFQPSPTRARQLFTFLYIGRLVEGKGLDILLRAFAGIGDNTKLVVVGSGPLAGKLKHLQSELNLSNVEWKGECDRQVVLQCIHECDAFVLPSLHENQPVSILEALACGKPVVATICGGSEELISEVNGLLAKAGVVDDLARKLTEITRSKFNSGEIRKSFMEKHGAARIIDQLEAIYKVC